ncbi:SLBB domain-containing protein [bacterium]|nr:SLBB domain-containing protein [bacterium]
MKARYIIIFSLSLIIFSIANSQILEFDVGQEKKDTGIGVTSPKFSLPDQTQKDKTPQVEKGKEILALEGSVDPAKYIVGPGDVFLLYIWGQFEEYFPITVTSDGYLLIPYLGSIDASGKTLSEVNKLLAGKINKVYKDAEYYLSLFEVRFIRVHVVGEVNDPGLYAMRATNRVTDAIALAGSTNTIADLENIKIIRKDSKDTLSANLLSYYQAGSLDDNPMLYGGDIVLVNPVRFNGAIIDINGASRKDGYYSLGEERGLREIISKVGGFNRTIDLTSIDLIRDGVHNRIDLVNTEENVTLKDRDIVILPNMPDSVYVEGFVNTPGAYPYQAGHTIKQYIGFAGGPNEEGTYKRVSVKRGSLEYSADDVLFVQRGDVITVKQSYIGKIADYIGIVSPLATIVLTAYALEIFK